MNAYARRAILEKIRIAEDTDSRDVSFVAINPVNRQALIDYFKALTEDRGTDSGGFNIRMPCGEDKNFTTTTDIPLGDLPCPCGRKDHYFIKYSKEPLGLNKLQFIS